MSFGNSNQHKKQSLSRINRDIELPKINKHIHQQPNSYTQRYEWLARKSEYLLLSQPAIQQQQQYLTNELNTLNQQYSDLLIKINNQYKVKPLKKSRVGNAKDKNEEHRDRQIDNNYIIMNKLKNECDILQKRMSSDKGGQYQIDKYMIESKEKILKLKQKIKQLKLRSKQMGQNIQNGPDLFIDLKKMENEKNVAQNKKQKLLQKVQLSQLSIMKLNQQLQEIAGNFLYAESYLQEQSINDKANAEQRTIEMHYKQKLYQLQITRKNYDSMRNVKQQRYLQSLKNLQSLVQVIKGLNSKVQKLQIKCLKDRKQIIQLQQLLSQAIDLKARSKTSQQNKEDTLIYRAGFDKGKTSRQDITNRRGKFYHIAQKPNQIRYRKNINSVLRQQQKTGSHIQRLRSSETKNQISYNSITKINAQKRSEVNMSAISNDLQIFSTQLSLQQTEILKMQPSTMIRGNYIRNIKSISKQNKIQELMINQSNIQDQQYMQKITQQSPTKEDLIQQEQQPNETIPVQKQNEVEDQQQQVQMKKSTVQENIVKETSNMDESRCQQEIIIAEKNTISVKSELQDSRLKSQKDVINNYMNKMQESDDNQFVQQI